MPGSLAPSGTRCSPYSLMISQMMQMISTAVRTIHYRLNCANTSGG